MSDKPLFQDADEQEAIFAPQQLPGETDRTTLETGLADDDTDLPIAAAPVLASGAAAGSGGPGYAGGSAGTVSGIAPAIGAVAIADELEKNDDERRD